jgi:hypothetical protein
VRAVVGASWNVVMELGVDGIFGAGSFQQELRGRASLQLTRPKTA